MTPLEYLTVEFENVSLALRETLRHDYGPSQSEGYYEECVARLDNIKANIDLLKEADTIRIQGTLAELSSHVANFVSLIERSRLGEFSWPFAEELRRVAKTLLAEKHLGDELVEPIIHVISEGEGYQIFYEAQVPPTSSIKRFLVVAFPRPLKHSVLMHTLFGHELGHTAIHATSTAPTLEGNVLQALTATSPLRNTTMMDGWVHRADAPANVKRELAQFSAQKAKKFTFTDKNREDWIVELICDAFGFLLFGPAFMAAHLAYLLPLEPLPSINTEQSTHPPFSVRHKFLLQMMKLTGWNTPITPPGSPLHRAEKQFLVSLMSDSNDGWAELFKESEVAAVITKLRQLFDAYDRISYKPVEASILSELVRRLMRGTPPVIANIDSKGAPQLKRIDIAQTLYAGWTYWAGKNHLKDEPHFRSWDFITVNRLCDHALLQQRAVDLVLSPGAT